MGAFFANFMAIVTILAPGIQTTGDPGAGYTWSLGDLADQSSRFDVMWDTGAWADDWDTEAEIDAQTGWEPVALHATSCADTSDGADESDFLADIEAACDPSGATNNDCEGIIFQLDSSCHYDFLGSTGNSDGVPAVSLPYSNYALVGAGMDSTYLDCNDSGSETLMSGPCIANTTGSPGYGTSSVGTVYTWASGSTVGTTVVTLTDGDGGTPCADIAAGDRLQLRGTSADGDNHYILNSVESVSGCDITLVDPIRMTVATPSVAVEGTAPNTRNTFFIGLSIGFPNYPDGVSRDAANTPGANLRWGHGDQLLLSEVRLGPYGRNSMDMVAGFHSSFRHSEFGPGQFSKRKGVQGGAFDIGRGGASGSISFFDNVQTDAAKRFVWVKQQAYLGSWYGFNYMTSQNATVSGETGNHCDGVGNPQGLAHAGFGPGVERTMFWGHDTNSGGKSGAFLVEANDLNCGNAMETDSGPQIRYSTMFRNRQNRYSGAFAIADSGPAFRYMNWIANRFNSWEADSAVLTNVLGRYNVATTTAGAMTASGYSWPTSGTFKNYVDSGPHDDAATMDLPPSLALQTNTAPSWWCTESGPWDGTWNFGAGDGYGGNTYKLPAQIRYEGTTCTPP